MFWDKINRVVKPSESEKKFKKTMEETPLEKNDLLAMILAAIITFLPAVIVVILIFLAVIWLFFLR